MGRSTTTTDWLLARTVAVQISRSVVSMTQPRMPCASAGLDLHEGRQLLRSLWSTRAAQQGRRTAVCTPYLRPPLLCAHWHSASSPNNRQTVSQNCDHPHKCQRLHHVPVKHSPAVCWAGGRPAGWSSWQPIASRPSGSLPCGRQTTDGAGRRLAISRGTPRDDLTTISCGGSQQISRYLLILSSWTPQRKLGINTDR